MSVTKEQNIAIKKAIRNDLRYIIPGVPTRYFYKRGPWKPASQKSGEPVEQDDGPSITPEGVISPPPASVWQDAVINIATAANHIIITGVPGRRIRIGTMFFTAGGDTNITLYDGASALTGAMDFGGVGEVRGIVTTFSRGPVTLNEGNAFSITLSAAVQVSGIVTYRVV